MPDRRLKLYMNVGLFINEWIIESINKIIFPLMNLLVWLVLTVICWKNWMKHIHPSKYQNRNCQALSIIKKNLTEQHFKHDSAQVSMYFRAGIGTHKISHTCGIWVARDSRTGNLRMIPASWNFDSLTAESRRDKNGQKRVVKEMITGSLHSFFPQPLPGLFPRSFTHSFTSLSLTHHYLRAWDRLCQFWHP